MRTEYVGPERRRAKRVKTTFIVLYKVGYPLQVRMTVGEREINAIMINLSEAGMAFLTNYNIPISTLLLMKFILINENSALDEERVRPMDIAGEVRYSIPGERDERRLGIYFTQISDADRHSIVNFMRNIQVTP